jgi:hypothetical protein
VFLSYTTTFISHQPQGVNRQVIYTELLAYLAKTNND